VNFSASSRMPSSGSTTDVFHSMGSSVECREEDWDSVGAIDALEGTIWQSGMER